jgi:hypothetical protein
LPFRASLLNGKSLTDMTSTETKDCRHCGEPILAVARVCKHCQSNQSWFSNQRDPRYLWLLLPIVLLAVVVPFGVLSLVEKKAMPTAAQNQKDSCRGLVEAKSSSYEVRTIEKREHMFVLVQVENKSSSNVSNPVIRVEILDANGDVKDTFIRSVYGADIRPNQSYLLRVEGDTIVDGSSVKGVRAEVASAVCKPAW